MKNYTQRINNIVGQLQGVDRMINDKKDCIDVLTQVKAVKSAVNSFMSKYIEEEFNNCMSCQTKADDSNKRLKKIFSEIVKN